MATYGFNEQARALQAYEDGSSISAISRLSGMPSRDTLQRWKKSGEPVALTGGKDWDEHIESKKVVDLERSRVRHLQEFGEKATSFQAQALSDVKVAWTKLTTQIQDGRVQASYSDLEKLMNLFIRLDNQPADKLLWLQDKMRAILGIVMNRVSSQATIDLIKMDLLALESETRSKLGPIPGAETIPSGVEALSNDRMRDLIEPEDISDAVVIAGDEDE